MTVDAVDNPALQETLLLRDAAAHDRGNEQDFSTDDKEFDQLIGGFQQKFFSLGGAFNVLGPDDNPLCELKGKWTGWDFRFMKDGVEFAHVTKKWSGLGKELFTSADNYILEMSDQVPQGNPIRQLIVAAVMCIDMVLKE